MSKHSLLITFITLFVLLTYFDALSVAKCHRRRNCRSNCCCRGNEEKQEGATTHQRNILSSVSGPSYPSAFSTSAIPVPSTAGPSSSIVSTSKARTTLFISENIPSSSALSAAALSTSSSPTVRPTSSASAIPQVSSSTIATSFQSSEKASSLSSALATTSEVTEPETTTLLSGTTKMTIRGHCFPAECLCTCEITEDLKTTRNYGRLPLNGGFGRTNLYQCDCTQDNFYTTIFVPARETSSVLEIATNHQIDTSSASCSSLCMLSEDGIFYTYPPNRSDQIFINYYCDDDNDQKSCAFYAFFLPSDGNPQNVTLTSDDGKNFYQNGDNTESLGRTSSYLKILGASCAGCCALSAAFVVPSCAPPVEIVQV